MSVVKILSLLLAVVVALSGPVTVVAQSAPSETRSAPSAPAAAPETATSEPGAAYKVGAVVATAFNMPLRGALCVLGVGAGLVVLLSTFGTGYRPATRVVEEGCGGPWIITAKHLQGVDQPTGDDGN